ncbi:MAG: BACON domain-containing protein [Prevotella sp.]|nr:BACON domain-containing protein [Prevotella sp.]
MIKYCQLIVLCIAVISCSNNSDEESWYLRIKESNITFSSSSGIGTIIVECNSTIKAESDAAWCVVTTKGNDNITVSVSKNSSVEGRVAKVKVNDAHGNSYQFGVTQAGCYLYPEHKSIYFNNSASNKLIPIHADEAISVSCDEGWLQAEISAVGLKISVNSNTTTRIRKASVTLEKGAVKDTLTIFQGEFQNLLGKYKFSSKKATNPQYGSDYSFITDITHDDNGNFCICNFRSSPNENIIAHLSSISIPLNILNGKLSCYINNGSFLGIGKSDNRNYSLFICQYAPSVGTGYQINAFSGPSLSLNFDIVDGKIVGKIEDNGSWPNGVTTNILYFIACSPASITKFEDRTSIGGFYDGMYDITLEKIEE